MYGENFKFSDRHLRDAKLYTEALIANYNERNKSDKSNNRGYAFDKESRMVIEHTSAAQDIDSRLQSFSNSVRCNLLVEAMYKMFKESMHPDDLNDNATTSIMRAMVSEYVNENGYFEIIRRMRSNSPTTQMIAKIITETHQAVMQSIDKSNPDTFRITPEMRDEFFKQLDYSDSQAVADAINQRVGDSMADFIDANKKDHEDIIAVLKQAQEKIGEVDPEDDSLKESYTRIATGKTNEIRNRPKSVFHAMVHTMCESVIKHKDMHAEFMSEGKLEIPKIVDRVKIMYTFMEMLNTSKIETVNEAFINNVIRDLAN